MNSSDSGIVVVDKPAGITSHDVVGKARRIYGTSRVGHTGTLDPAATGVLVLCIGHATRAAEYISGANKCYRAGIQFGVTTTTEDASGDVLVRESTVRLTRTVVEAALEVFRGEISQVPPMYSAVHHEGKRLYELARKGIEVTRVARTVRIESITLREFCPGEEAFGEIELVCSSGTYVRTLCADIGRQLGVGAMMRCLRRVWVGESHMRSFGLSESYLIPDLELHSKRGTQRETLLPIRSALFGWPIMEASEPGAAMIRLGRAVHIDECNPVSDEARMPLREGSRVALVEPGTDVFALAVVESNSVQPRKVFV